MGEGDGVENAGEGDERDAGGADGRGLSGEAGFGGGEKAHTMRSDVDGAGGGSESIGAAGVGVMRSGIIGVERGWCMAHGGEMRGEAEGCGAGVGGPVDGAEVADEVATGAEAENGGVREGHERIPFLRGGRWGPTPGRIACHLLNRASGTDPISFRLICSGHTSISMTGQQGDLRGNFSGVGPDGNARLCGLKVRPLGETSSAGAAEAEALADDAALDLEDGQLRAEAGGIEAGEDAQLVEGAWFVERVEDGCLRRGEGGRTRGRRVEQGGGRRRFGVVLR